MIITKLIEELSLLDNISKPLLASVDVNVAKKLYVDLFVHSQGFPAIMIYEEKRLPSNKLGNVLLEELQTWEKKSIHYDSESNVYLMTNYKHEDESYDFRYFKLKAVIDEGDSLILIADPDECIDLREHYEAFDENMFADN